MRAQARHFHRHGRFYAAAVVGLLVYAATAGRHPPFRILLAGDVFFLVYLALMLAFAGRVTPAGLRARAAREDEGSGLIVLLTALAVSFSLVAIVLVLNRPPAGARTMAGLALASVPLGWGMVHTLAAFHYANLFYSPPVESQGETEAGGLAFPGTAQPGMLEFLYYALVIGMTAQVSDVAVVSRPLRRATLTHGVISFFYNTVLIAIVVNAAIAFAG